MSKTTIEINGDASGFTDAAKEVNKGQKDIEKGAQTSAKGANSAWSSFVGTFSALALQKAFSLATDGFKSLVSGAKQAVEDAKNLEVSINTLNSALIQTGKFTKESSKDIQEFTFGLQSVSKFGGDVITKNAGLIQSLAKLEKDGLKSATRGAVDLASAFNIDLGSASAIVGKALSGQTAALKKYGIEIVETGDKQRDQAAILKALADNFGGASLKAIQTFDGAQQQLANTQSDLSAAFGKVITDSPAVTGAIRGYNQILESLIKIVDENRDSIFDFVDRGVGALIPALGFASTGAGFVIDSITALNSTFVLAKVAVAKLAEGFFFAFEGILSAAGKVASFFGKDSALIEGFREEAAAIKEILNESSAEELNGAMKFADAQERKKTALKSFTESAQVTLRQAIDAQKELTKEEVANESEKQSAMNAARIAGAEIERAIASEKEENLINDFITANQFKLDEIARVLGEEEALKEEARARELAGKGDLIAAEQSLEAARIKARKEDIFTLQKFENLSQKERLANIKSTLGQISSLQSSSSKELFAIGKAAAISTATIDGFQAVQKALASAPPPFNIALAGIVGVATAANIAKIASAKPPTGAFNGALVEGGSIFSDSQPFMLSKGEIVAPRKDFDDVVEGTARQRGFVKSGEGDQKKGQAVSVNIQGDIIGSDQFVNDLIEKIRDAVQFRNADLGV
jgi:hypothetical protein